jgi:hypothetical protein
MDYNMSTTRNANVIRIDLISGEDGPAERSSNLNPSAVFAEVSSQYFPNTHKKKFPDKKKYHYSKCIDEI